MGHGGTVLRLEKEMEIKKRKKKFDRDEEGSDISWGDDIYFMRHFFFFRGLTRPSK